MQAQPPQWWGLEPPEVEVNEAEADDRQDELDRREESFYEAADYYYDLEGDR